ncbi:MAG: ATPase [Desulfurococcales archaeon ex4484_217_1]|nr:ATPase [Thermoprotei archaeon]OYT56405.1 MAG: ATPase [Desulfurococcales archaeon ex4484_217_2]OYT60785.1 MAG: ATPase [Desulfurococcales archaeon ex4484_217_1]
MEAGIGPALAIIGGTLALTGGLVGSSIGVGIAGSAGAAAVSEDPKQFRNVLLLASLPMTQTFYGLIILLYIITQILPGIQALPADEALQKGLMVLGVGLVAAFAEGFSAAYQGIICSSGIAFLPKTKGLNIGSSIILAVYAELFGILGMVFAILTLILVI